MSADGRRSLNQVHLEAGGCQIQRSLDAADAAADNHDVSKMTVRQAFAKPL
jgi:hypothetical protein